MRQKVIEVLFWLLVAVGIVATFRAVDQHTGINERGPWASPFVAVSLFSGQRVHRWRLERRKAVSPEC